MLKNNLKTKNKKPIKLPDPIDFTPAILELKSAIEEQSKALASVLSVVGDNRPQVNIPETDNSHFMGLVEQLSANTQTLEKMANSINTLILSQAQPKDDFYLSVDRDEDDKISGVQVLRGN